MHARSFRVEASRKVDEKFLRNLLWCSLTPPVAHRTESFLLVCFVYTWHCFRTVSVESVDHAANILICQVFTATPGKKCKT